MTEMMKLTDKSIKTYVPHIQEDSKKHKQNRNTNSSYKTNI